MATRFIQLSASPEQKELLKELMGSSAPSICVDTLRNVAYVEPHTCRSCLLDTSIPGVSIDESGLCNHCREYAPVTPQQHAEALEGFMADGDRRVVVAFSGGKDSASTLVIAKNELGLEPHALMVDNGFMPAEVVERARGICEVLNVSFSVETINIVGAVRNSLEQYYVNPSPCQICIHEVFRKVARYCAQSGYRKVIGGHRYPPISYTLDGFTGREGDKGIRCISLLLGRNMTEEEQMKLIGQAGYAEQRIHGNSTNCTLLGYADNIYFNRFGRSSVIEEVSKEIRAGFITREGAAKKVERPILPPPLVKEISRKLSFHVPDEVFQ